MMSKHIVPPPKRTCRHCGQGGQIIFRKCPKCGRRYLGNKTFGTVH
jgi:primosomal protein N'